MQLSALIRRHRAMTLALAGVVAASAAAIAQTTTGQKTTGQNAPTQAAPAPKAPAPKPTAPAKPAPTTAAPKTTPQTRPAAAAPAAPGAGVSDRYVATAANLAGVAGETITVDLIRWSTDAERDKVLSTTRDKGD